MTKYRIVPVEPTREMILELMSVGLRHAEYVDERGPSVAEMAQGYHFMLAAAPSPWISVGERHPTEMAVVLVTDGNHVVPGYHSMNGDEVLYTADGYESFLLKGEITHWMPLPEAPEVAE